MTSRLHIVTLALMALALWPAATRAEAVTVESEAELRAAWSDPRQTTIELNADIFLRACKTGEPIRESPWPMTSTATVTRCARPASRSGAAPGRHRVRAARGHRPHPRRQRRPRAPRSRRAARSRSSTRAMIAEPGRGAGRRRLLHAAGDGRPTRCITGNLANDDGGARVRAPRRRSRSTTRCSTATSSTAPAGRSARPATSSSCARTWTATRPTATGARSTPTRTATSPSSSRPSNGSTRDGPGGAIFTLDGRRDDRQLDPRRQPRRRSRRRDLGRGGRDRDRLDDRAQRRGRARRRRDLVARDLFITNSTISDNYAEGLGGGVLAAGDAGLAIRRSPTTSAPAGANVAAGDAPRAFGSLIGPARITSRAGQVAAERRPTARARDRRPWIQLGDGRIVPAHRDGRRRRRRRSASSIPCSRTAAWARRRCRLRTAR